MAVSVFDIVAHIRKIQLKSGVLFRVRVWKQRGTVIAHSWCVIVLAPVRSSPISCHKSSYCVCVVAVFSIDRQFRKGTQWLHKKTERIELQTRSHSQSPSHFHLIYCAGVTFIYRNYCVQSVFSMKKTLKAIFLILLIEEKHWKRFTPFQFSS